MFRVIQPGRMLIVFTVLLVFFAGAGPAARAEETGGRCRVAPLQPPDLFLAAGSFTAESYAVLACGWWQGSRWPEGSSSRPRFPVPTLLIADDTGTFFWASPAAVRVVEEGRSNAGLAGFTVFPREAERFGGRVPASLGPAVTGTFRRGENRVLEVVCPLVTEGQHPNPQSSRAARPYFLVADDHGIIVALYFDELLLVREEPPAAGLIPAAGGD
jgi:hypothetical protein